MIAMASIRRRRNLRGRRGSSRYAGVHLSIADLLEILSCGIASTEAMYLATASPVYRQQLDMMSLDRGTNPYFHECNASGQSCCVCCFSPTCRPVRAVPESSRTAVHLETLAPKNGAGGIRTAIGSSTYSGLSRSVRFLSQVSADFRNRRENPSHQRQVALAALVSCRSRRTLRRDRGFPTPVISVRSAVHIGPDHCPNPSPGAASRGAVGAGIADWAACFFCKWVST
jgi:hypothetical protein